MFAFSPVLFIGYETGYRHWTLRQQSLLLEMALWPLIVGLFEFAFAAAAFEALSALVVDLHR